MKKCLLILLLAVCFIFTGCSNNGTIGFVQNADGTLIEYYVIPYAENELISAGLTKEESVAIKAKAKLMLDQTFTKYIDDYKARIEASTDYTDAEKEILKKAVRFDNSFNNKTEQNFEIDLGGNITATDAITYIRYELYFANKTSYIEFKNANEALKEEKQTIVEKSLFTTTTKVVKDPLFDKMQEESITLGKKVMGITESTVLSVLAGEDPDETAISIAQNRWSAMKLAVGYEAMSEYFTYCYVVPTARLKSNAQKVVMQDGYYYHMWKVKSTNSSLPEDEQITFEYWTVTANKAVWYGLSVLGAVIVIIISYFVGKKKEKQEELKEIANLKNDDVFETNQSSENQKENKDNE